MIDLNMETLIFDTGERYPMLVDSGGMPDFYISLFITVMMRPKSETNTLVKVLSALKHLRRWEEFNDRRLDDEFYEGRLLELADLHSIRDHCKLDSDAFENWVAQKKAINAGDLVNVASLNRNQSPQILSVSNNHRAIRMGYIAAYLKFLAETVMRVRPDYPCLLPQIDRMIGDFRKLIPRTRSYQQNSGVSRTPDHSVFETYLYIAKPGSIDNPFKNPGRQLRHFIMMSLQFEAGLRPGEVLALWAEDIEYGAENYVHVVRRHHDPRDPRIRQEVAKTKPRVLPIDHELARLIHKYVVEVRNKIPEAQSHPLLFVTHASNGRGQPISSKAVMQEVGQIINIRPDTLAGLTRHQFRHGFANHAKEVMGEKGIQNASQEPIMQQALGHGSPESQKPYTDKYVQKEASKTLQEINRERHGKAKSTDIKKDA